MGGARPAMLSSLVPPPSRSAAVCSRTTTSSLAHSTFARPSSRASETESLLWVSSSSRVSQLRSPGKDQNGARRLTNLLVPLLPRVPRPARKLPRTQRETPQAVQLVRVPARADAGEVRARGEPVLVRMVRSLSSTGPSVGCRGRPSSRSSADLSHLTLFLNMIGLWARRS